MAQEASSTLRSDVDAIEARLKALLDRLRGIGNKVHGSSQAPPSTPPSQGVAANASAALPSIRAATSNAHSVLDAMDAEVTHIEAGL